MDLHKKKHIYMLFIFMKFITFYQIQVLSFIFLIIDHVIFYFYKLIDKNHIYTYISILLTIISNLTWLNLGSAY